MQEIAKRIRRLAEKLDACWHEDNDFHLDENMVEAVLDEMKQYACEITSHEFGPDQCGYWHHDFCYQCQTMKYPELAKLSCGEFREKYGNTTEQEYLDAMLLGPEI